MNSDCPLGFECVIDESLPLYRRNICANKDTCYTWVAPWQLPYWWDYNGLMVSFSGFYNNLQDYYLCENPITSQYHWRKYFAEYGFAEAVNLPYYLCRDSIVVSIAHDHICREELQKAGFANAVTLPLQKRKEYYSPDTYDGFNYQEVDLFWCGEVVGDPLEAINALEAGYADAVTLLPTSLDQQKWECDNSFYE
jgi:hypothetical protein